MKKEGSGEIDDSKVIKGLLVINSFITKEEEKKLLGDINKQTWLNDLKRRVQHYGYKYDYKTKLITDENFLGKLPSFCEFVLERVKEQKLIKVEPDQLIVNEYLPGQGISPHIDKVDFFEEDIMSLSLGSDVLMTFTNAKNPNQNVDVLLKRASLLCISGEARYGWKHSISQKKSDMINGKKVRRTTRVSLTFRKVKNVLKK
jgi:alkylated DNA repair dioxygenase AlkB